MGDASLCGTPSSETWRLATTVHGVRSSRAYGWCDDGQARRHALWHRLRIISGLPRTAIADQDPKIIAAQTGPAFEPVSEGREIQLDVSLLRDPFDTPSLQSVQVVTTLENDSLATSDSHARISPEQSRLVDAISSIRRTGTAKGLGTALVDGSVRSIGARFDVSDYTFQLTSVHAGAIHLKVVENPVFNGWRCIVDREGAMLLPSE